MRLRSRNSKAVCTVVKAVGTILVLLGAGAEGKEPLKDAGLVTAVSGEVTCSNQFQKEPERVVNFMKVRAGDRIELRDKASLRIVYFATGLEETWRRPAKFTIGEKGGEGGEQARPEVKTLPVAASSAMKRLPVLLRRAGADRAGMTMLRSYREKKEGKPAEVVSITPEERAEVESAKQTYKQMLAQSEAGDATPEMFLVAVLADYEQYAEMAEVLKVALKKQPGNELLKGLNEWVAEQQK